MNLQTIVERLDEELAIDAYADLDGSPNGLQVGVADHEVESAVLAVDAVSETIDAAGDADLLITHHGLWWEGIERLTGRTYEHVRRLTDHGIALYVAHLPLDGHQRLGNAARLAGRLGLEDREPFGALEDQWIGQMGVLPEATSPAGLADELAESLPTGDGTVRALPFGPDEVSSVGIVTGSGVDWLAEAEQAGVDAFVTGEGKHRVYHEARERELTVILAGHYATETGGVRAVGERLAEWGVETRFVDVPTGL